MGVLVGELLITMAALALEVAGNVISVKNVNVGTQVSAQAEAGSVYIQREKSPRAISTPKVEIVDVD